MPGATTNRAYPYPVGGDAPDGPGSIFALAKALDDEAGDGVVGFPGTITNYSGRTSTVRRAPGGIAVLSFSLFLAGGFTVANNPQIASVPAGWRPKESTAAVAALYSGSAWTGYALVDLGTGGTLSLNFMSTTAVGIIGNIAYRV